MKNNRRQHYEGALLEEMNSKIDRMAEILAGVVEGLRINTLKLEKLDKIEADVTIIKSVLIEHSKELKDHRSRIHTLETRVFS